MLGTDVDVLLYCPKRRMQLKEARTLVRFPGSGERTLPLDAFVDATKALEDGAFVRLKLIALNARPKVLTVKLDLHYWPTWELRRTTDGTNEWERVLL